MANLKEQAIWEVGIYQWETSDPVLGGENGIDNVPTKQLANRTAWLKNEISVRIAEIGTQKANKATTLAGYGITDSFTQAQINSFLAGKVNNTVTVTGSNGLKGGGALSGSQSLTIDKATAADLAGGTVNKVITADVLQPLLDEKALAADALIKKIYTGSNLVAADAQGQGFHSYGSSATDAPKWSSGSSVGAIKLMQYGTAEWDSQIATQGYGECVWVRSRRVASGPYSDWKRLDGGDWSAKETECGHIANKPTNLVTTDAAQTITASKTFSAKQSFSSAALIGFASWQDTINLGGSLPTINVDTMGLGFSKADKTIYFADFEDKKYGMGYGFKTGVLTLYSANADITLAGVSISKMIGDKLNKTDFETELLKYFSQNRVENGYTKLPNGIVLQWGRASAANGAGSWVYPIAFPTQALVVIASQDAVAGVTYTVGAQVDGTDSTTLKTRAKVSSTLTTGNDSFYAFAIGY